jgi:hypothetical protein
MSTDPGIWVAALCTIAIYSYLYKENMWYQLVEHLYVGVAAGYTVTMGWTNVQSTVWRPLTTKGDYLVLVPAALGLMLFVPFISPSLKWVRRFPIAVIIGIGAGLTVRTAVIQQFTAQLRASIISMNTVDNVIIVIGTVATLSYFFFTFKPNPALNLGSEIGKWVIMVTFGAAFGNGIMGRISLLIGRILLVFRDWLPLIPK